MAEPRDLTAYKEWKRTGVWPTTPTDAVLAAPTVQEPAAPTVAPTVAPAAPSSMDAYKQWKRTGVWPGSGVTEPVALDLPSAEDISPIAAAKRQEASDLTTSRRRVQGSQNEWIRARATELVDVGDGKQSFSQAGALNKAEEEYQERFGVPMTSSRFSELPVKQGDFLAAPLSNLEPAGEPDVPDLLKSALGRQREFADPQMVQLQAQGSSDPNWESINSAMIESGVDAAAAETEIAGFRAGYAYLRTANPSASAEDLLMQVVEERNDVPRAISDTDSYLKDTDLEKLKGINDPWYQFLRKQYRPGQGVPDLSPVQQQMMYAQIQRGRAEIYSKEVSAIEERKPTNTQIKVDGTWLPFNPASPGAYMDGQAEDLRIPYENAVDAYNAGDTALVREIPFSDQQIKNIAQRATDEQLPEQWWADPALKEKVVANPREYDKRQLFVWSTPYGGTIESLPAYGLRAALSPLNLVAGAATEYFDGGALAQSGIQGERPAGFDLQEERKAQRVADDPIYADSPILYNIATNRGFAGESIGNAAILKEQGIGTPASRGAMIGLGVVADFLDPSIAITGGTTALAKGAVKGTAASRALRAGLGGSKTLRTADLAQGLNIGTRVGAAEFIDLAVPFYGPKLAAKIEVGDPRLMVAGTMATEASAYRRALSIAGEPPPAISAVELPRSTTLEEVASGLRADFGDSRMTKALEAGSLREGEAVQDAVRRIGTEVVAPDLLTHMQGVAKQIDELLSVRTYAPGALSQPELARQIGAFAKAKEVKLGSNTIAGHIRTLDNKGMIDPLINQMVYSKAVSESIKASKDMKFLSNIVQVTSNTFAPRGSLKEVLSFVKDKTEAGRLATRLVDEKVPIVSINTERGPELYFDLSKAKNGEEIGRMYDVLVDELQQFRRLSGADIRLRPGKAPELAGNATPLYPTQLIGVSDLRTAIDGTIDLVARGSQLGPTGKVTGQGLFRASDTANLPPARQLDLLQPGVARTDTLAGTVYRQIVKPLIPKSLTGPAFRKIKKNLFPNLVDDIPQTLNVAQRQSLNEMKNSLDTMDRGLRKSVKRFLNDPEFRASLGAPADKNFTSNNLEEILGYITVGKGPDDPSGLTGAAYVPRPVSVIRGDIESQLTRSLDWTARRYVYATQPRAGLRGTEIIFSDSFLTPAGRGALDDLATETAEAMYRNPEEYTELYSRFLQDWHKQLGDNSVLWIDPSLHSSLKLTTQGAEIPNELLVGTYYHMQRDRILNATAKRMFQSDVASAKAVLGESWSPAYRDAIASKLSIGLEGKDLQKVFDDVLRERTVARIEASLGGAPLKSIDKFKDDVLITVMRNEDPTAVPLPLGAINSDPGFAVAWRTLVGQADEAASSIIRSNKLGDLTIAGVKQDANNIIKSVKDRFTGEAGATTRLAMGADTYDAIFRLIENGGFNKIEKFFAEQAVRKGTSNLELKNILIRGKEILRGIQDVFYTAILGLRPRFHGVNMMTAPFIAKSTVNQFAVTAPLKRGQDLAGATRSAGTLGVNKMGGSKWTDVAHIDEAGRLYTHGDIYERIVLGGGLRSAASFEVSENIINDAMSIVPPKDRSKIGALRDNLRATTRFNELMDSYFRLNVAYKALDEGRSIEEATALARRAMFDYGDMTKFERDYILKATVFYSFTRQNTAQLMKNMLSPAGWQRIAFGLKSERDFEDVMGYVHNFGDQDDTWSPDYTLTRPIMRKMELENKDLAFLGPSIPANEAIVFAINIFSKPYTESIARFVRPDVGTALGVEGFKQSTWKLQPQHVAAFELGGDSMWSLLEFLLGGEPLVGTPATPEEGGVNGYIYKLSDAQEARYKKWMSASRLLGTSTAYKDYLRSAGLTDEPGFESGMDRFLFTTGFQTPVKMERPEKIESENLRDLKRAIDEDTKQMRER